MEIYREVLRRHGVKNGIFTMVLLAMYEFGMSYCAALMAVAEFKHLEYEPLHSRVCYWLLLTGTEEHPERWFARLVDEVREMEEHCED